MSRGVTFFVLAVGAIIAAAIAAVAAGIFLFLRVESVEPQPVDAAVPPVVAAPVADASMSITAAPAPSAATTAPYVISVTGTGTAATSPDIADVTLGVETLASDADVAIRDNTDQMNAVSAALRDSGVAGSDIQTRSFNMWVEQIYGPDGPTGEVRYHVNNQVSARVREIDRVGEILQRALEAGANNVGGISFGVEDTAALERTARDQAVADARAKAEQLATALGVQLGAVRQVSEAVQPVPFQHQAAFGFEAAAADLGGAAPVPVSGGEFTVSASLQVVFDIAR